ncbi:LysR family transcriptional regulator [Sphingobacterium sp. N143]|uniref:LysR family transcriptional regulator n=1 Tax=Sphingobacterium sp. N143 TaxID=2746727 RepID=UPI002577C376|nr:LysR family transcriptional regulator [Sphingobacterium sp. N143]MDM1295319.1 LysR family transcriptional regulator [Sphingobacterium sp. N143]
MNLNDLKLFDAVAYHGSFTKAAEAMHTVQSNVTARIKILEDEFGTALFLRTSRKVSLTPAGFTLLESSKKISNIIAETKLSIGGGKSINGQIRIGFLETTMALRGPGLVNELAAKFPQIEIDFKSAMRDKLIDDVLNFKLDAAFVPAPIDSEELGQVHIMDESLVVVAPIGISSLDELVQQLQIKTIVFDQGCFFRARLESWLGSKKISNYHRTVMSSIEGVVNFIESGIGFSFLPKELITTFYKERKLKIFSLPAEIGAIKTVLIYRKENTSDPLLNAFMSLFH